MSTVFLLCYSVVQRYTRQNQVFGSATLTDTAERLRVPYEVIEPTFDGLVRDGLRAAHRRPIVADSGRNQTGRRHTAVIVGRIVDKLATSSSFEGRPDRAQVEAALERIAHRMLVQRDWADDRGELVAAG